MGCKLCHWNFSDVKGGHGHQVSCSFILWQPPVFLRSKPTALLQGRKRCGKLSARLAAGTLCRCLPQQKNGKPLSRAGENWGWSFSILFFSVGDPSNGLIVGRSLFFEFRHVSFSSVPSLVLPAERAVANRARPLQTPHCFTDHLPGQEGRSALIFCNNKVPGVSPFWPDMWQSTAAWVISGLTSPVTTNCPVGEVFAIVLSAPRGVAEKHALEARRKKKKKKLGKYLLK